MPYARSASATVLALVAALSLFSGCAATGNYHGDDGYFGGFSEEWQSDRTVTVHYGLKDVRSQEASKNAMLRASDLAIQRGFTHFRVTSDDTEVTNTSNSLGATLMTGTRNRQQTADVDITVVMLDEAQAREMEAAGNAVVNARFYVEQNASRAVKRRILGQ